HVVVGGEDDQRGQGEAHSADRNCHGRGARELLGCCHAFFLESTMLTGRELPAVSVTVRRGAVQSFRSPKVQRKAECRHSATPDRCHRLARGRCVSVVANGDTWWWRGSRATEPAPASREGRRGLRSS